MPRRNLRRALVLPAIATAALLVLAEEAFWRVASAAGALLARIPIFALAERLVERLPPAAVFGLFLVPMAALLPAKLAGTWLVLNGHAAAGIALLVGLKVVGTAFSARLFAIARPKLMTVGAFAWCYGKATAALGWARGVVASMPAVRAARGLASRARAAISAMAARAGKGGLLAAALRLARAGRA